MKTIHALLPECLMPRLTDATRQRMPNKGVHRAGLRRQPARHWPIAKRIVNDAFGLE